MTQLKPVAEVDSDLEDLIPLFLKSREEDLQGLAEGLQENDFNRLRAIGHDMKGTGRSFGFHPVSEMGDLIETAALAGDLATIQAQFALFKTYMAEVEIKYVQS